MKKVLFGFAIALSFAACKGKTDTTTNAVTYDTTGDYQRRLADSAASVSTLPVNDDTILTSDGNVYVKVDGDKEKASAAVAKKPTTTRRSTANTSRSTTRRSTTGSGSTAGSGTGASTSTGDENATTTTPEKKGWSNAAKGAAIGAAGGAVTGAIISKKKGKGAIIGGAVGAAGGYILGRKKDKRTGRDTL